MSKILVISRKSPLTSNPSSEDWYISCVIDVNWFVHESPGLKPDWFGEIKSFPMKYSNRLLYINRWRTFPQIWSRDTGRKFFKIYWSLFLWTGITFDIFHSLRNSPCLMQDWKISSSGLQISLPHIFNMWVLIMSWP